MLRLLQSSFLKKDLSSFRAVRIIILCLLISQAWLIDTGKAAEKMLDEVGITVNKNAIPFDTQKPFVTSGIRISTAATTTRGFVEEDMVEIGKLIGLTLKDFDNSKDDVMARVKALCEKHPLYE